MKKKIIIGLLFITAMTFGHYGSYSDEFVTGKGYGSVEMMDSGHGFGGMMGRGYNFERRMEIMLNENNLSEKQRAEIFTMIQRRRNSTYKNSLEIREKELALEKKLAVDKVDWIAVEKLNKEISDFRAKERLEEMKFIKEIEDK
ncbi:hypothetical protein NOY06_10510, partial [Psychrilyobacter sp. S5]